MSIVTSFSSLLEHVDSVSDNSEIDKNEDELYCATAFITILQAGLITQKVGKSDDGFTDNQDALDRLDFESQCAKKCLEKIMLYDLPEGIRNKLIYFKPRVEEISRLNHYIAVNNRQMQETLSTAFKKKKSNSGCMVIMLILVAITVFNFVQFISI